MSTVLAGERVQVGRDMKPEREFKRREVDQGTVAVAAVVAKSTSATFWSWFDRHHVDALAVIGVTLWLTVDVVQWALQFADDHYSVDGLQIAAIIGAVLTPWGLAQSAMFKFYIDLKGKNGNGGAK